MALDGVCGQHVSGIYYRSDEQQKAAETSRDAYQQVLTAHGHGPITTEQAGVRRETARQMTEPVYGVFACLRGWCFLIERMEREWRCTDYYMVYEYLNALTVRDALDGYLDAMSPSLQEKMRRVVIRFDDRYAAVTVDDGGAEFARYCRPLAEGRETRWWWTRKPLSLPPGR